MQNERKRRGWASPGSRLPSNPQGPGSAEPEGPFGGRGLKGHVSRVRFGVEKPAQSQWPGSGKAVPRIPALDTGSALLSV